MINLVILDSMAKSSIFFGVDLATVNWYFVGYVLFSIFLLAGGLTKLYPMGMARAVIFGIGALLILVFYGYRWFGGSKARGNTSWPPTINTCPDYLTYIESLPGDQAPGCVDMLGVSTNGSLKVTLLSDITDEGASLASTSADKVFPFTSNDITDAADPSAVQGICKLCTRYGLTWEGVYDGDTCVGVAASKAAQEAADSGKCS